MNGELLGDAGICEWKRGLACSLCGHQKFKARRECSRDVIESKLINASNEVFADQLRIFNYKQQPTISS
jgi:hypothetical protein